MPKLHVENGPSKGQSLVLSSKSPVVIGREPGCDLVFNDSNVSRKHCELSLKSATWFVRDLGSRNGTYLNGERITGEARLSVGDRLQTGEFFLSVLDEKEGTNEGGLIGQRIGGYRILERLGRGGMGTVYKANQIALNREVALKLLSADLIKEEMFKNLFIAEARAAAALNHPNIVQVHDVGCENGMYYFSMEFMPNGSIHDVLTREGRVSPSRALRMAMDAAAGLAYAERKGIVHRDIKPENLMIADTGAIKIGDLGLALNVQKGDVDDQVGVMGTPHYCAPEQVTRGKIDHRTDIYSLGATIYRMLAGRPPFTGQTLKEILVKKVRESATPLSQVVPNLPASVNDLVMQMLEKDPSKRPGSAEEVKGRIEAIRPEVEGLGAGGGSRPAAPPAVGSSTNMASSTVSTAPTGPTLILRPGRVMVAMVSVLFAVLIGAAGIIVWKATRNGGSGSTGPADANGGNRTPGGGDGQNRQDLAWAMVQEAEQWARSNEARVQTKEGAGELIGRYQQVIDKFPGTPAAEFAKRNADDCKSRLFAMYAEEALVAATKAYDEAKQAFEETLDLEKLEAVVPAFRQLTEKYRGTRAADAAAETIADILTLIQKARDAAVRWEETDKEATNLTKQERFSEALQKLQNFAKEFEDSSWDDRAISRCEDVEKAAHAGWARFLEVQLNPLIESKSWALALKALDDWQGRFGVADLEQRLKEKKREVADLALKSEPPPDGPPDDSVLEADALAAADELMSAWKFSEAITLLRAAILKIKSPDANARLQAVADDCDYLVTIKSAIRAHASGNDQDDSGMKDRAFRGAHINGATDQGLVLSPGGEFPWSKMTGLDAFRMAFGSWIPSGREAIGIGLLCMRSFAWRSARYSFGTAGHRDPSLETLAHLLIDRSEREERSRVPTDSLAARLFTMEEAERKAAEAAAERIISVLGKKEDLAGQGEVYSSMQQWPQSGKHYDAALKIQHGMEREEVWRAHVFLMLNAIMDGDDVGFKSHRYLAADLFPQEYYSQHVKAGDKMREKIVASLAQIDELRETMHAKPTVETAVALLDAYDNKVHMQLEKRIVARWVTEIEEWRRTDDVKTGEPLRILAQTCLEMKDYFEGKKMLERLRRNYPLHEWCRTPENGQRKVDSETLKATEKIKKYGLGSK